jgi:hypothetical protein
MPVQSRTTDSAEWTRSASYKFNRKFAEHLADTMITAPA